mmetsp:Transcript_26209/g.104869  ORF Transcript_26209/g.104869 Transcript_26209/m.104869 type:complete len:250 (-) Transcript_26209:9-758(-)
MEPLVELLGRRRHDATDRHVVAVEVLGRRVERHVAAEVDRLEHHGRAEGRVADVEDAVLLGDGRDGGDVGQRERRVGRRLGIDQLGLAGLDRRLDVRRVAEVDERELDAVLHELLARDAVRAAVRTVRQHAVVALRQKGRHDRHRGGHARREAARARGVLECRDLLLEDAHGRVRRARVRVPLAHVLVDRLLDEGRRLVHGRQDRARRLVGRDARVHQLRLEPDLARNPRPRHAADLRLGAGRGDDERV